MTEADGAWMARILARFSPHQVALLVQSGRFSDPGDVAFLTTVLEGRLNKILDRYLTRLSPIADVRFENPGQLCGVDLAERRAMREATQFAYQAFDEAQPSVRFPVQRGDAGKVCVTVPAPAPHSPPSYVRVRIYDGVAQGPLVAHLYSSEGSAGYQLAGLERPEK
jgi:hypothetical protein